MEARTTDEVLERVRRGEIRPPRSLNPNVPRALEAVCLKALAPRPEDRYPTARALADDVERWLADEPVTAWREPLRRSSTTVDAAASVLDRRRRRGLAPGGRIPLGDRGPAEHRQSQPPDRSRAGRSPGRTGDPGRSRLPQDRRGEYRRQESPRNGRPSRPCFARLIRSTAGSGTISRGPLGASRRSGQSALSYVQLARLTDEIGTQVDAIEAYRQAIEILTGLLRDRPGDRGASARTWWRHSSGSGASMAAMDSLGRRWIPTARHWTWPPKSSTGDPRRTPSPSIFNWPGATWASLASIRLTAGRCLAGFVSPSSRDPRWGRSLPARGPRGPEEPRDLPPRGCRPGEPSWPSGPGHGLIPGRRCGSRRP